MNPECPSPENLASLPFLPEAERDILCAHLADCSACRREVSLAALMEDAPLPVARLDPSRFAGPPRRRSWLPATLSAAAALLLAASALFLWTSLERKPNLPAAPSPAVRTSPPSARPDDPGEPPSTARETRPLPRPPSPDRPLPPAPPAPRDPAPPPPPTGLARENNVVAQAVPVFPLAGSVTLGGRVLTQERSAGPSDVLSSADGGNLRVMEHLRVHLGRSADISVSWSQSLECPSLTVRKGEALVELGPTPRTLHVSGGGIGLRIEGASGDVYVSAEEGELRAAPLSAPARLRARDGSLASLPAGTAVVLGTSGESFVPAPTPDAGRFPTRKAAPAPAPPPPPPPPAAPDPMPAVGALRTSGYRFSAQGRRLRTGAYKDNHLISIIDDFAAYRPLGEPAATHLRRGSRSWNQLGVIRGEDERIVAALRAAQAPHVQLDIALGGRRGDPEIRADKEAWIYRWELDPARVRAEVETWLDRATLEERLDKPREVYWDTLEGSLELTVSKENPRVLRVSDRRRVAYLPPAPTAPRTWYRTDTVTAFYDHGRVALTPPK